jgi:hypothetical protein
MRIDKNKGWVLGLLGGAILVIFLLAIGLTGLKMTSGLLFNLSPRPQTTIIPGDMPEWAWMVDLFRIILALALVIFPFYIIYMLINPKRRKQLIRDVVIFGFVLFLFDRLRNLSQSLSNRGSNLEPGANPADAGLPPEIPPLTEFLNNPPNWLVVVVIVAVIIVIAAIFFLIFWFALRKRPDDSDAITRVAQDAQDALLSIQSGGDLREAIIQCYRGMMQAVKKERGIHRETYVTSREFVTVLTGRGLPAGPVKDLTRLFEDVRYGNMKSGMRQQIEAVSCLEEILEACRRQKEAA